MRSDNGETPSKTTCFLWFWLLRSDIPHSFTRIGLPPSPTRFAFPGTGTVFVIAFIFYLCI